MASTATSGGREYDRTQELKRFDESKMGVKGLSDSGITSIPKFFIHPPQALADIKINKGSSDGQISIPVIDLAGVESAEKRPGIVEKMKEAASTWGFFQVVNHGVPIEALESAIGAIEAFHEQPPEVKSKYYKRDAELGGVMYTSNNDLYRSEAAAWHDSLQAWMGPTPVNPEELPEICRNEVVAWDKQANNLGETVMELLSEGLGLDSVKFKELSFSQTRVMVGHCYPYCPEPDLTVGITSHTDPGIITVLLQNQVGGLQVKHEEYGWVDVRPLHGGVIINVGDFLQIISNGVYRSVQHRVSANGSKTPRISVVEFFNLSKWREADDYGPLPELLSPERPAIYRDFTMQEFNENFYSKGLDSKSFIEKIKIRVWGNIVWAHSVFKDLINWKSLDPAIYPYKKFDINGCWSGSATILPGGKLVIMYTGIDPNNRQVQNYAVPEDLSDPFLRKWVKPDDNPIVDPDPAVNASAFRDPTTGWFVDGKWKIAIGSKRDRLGLAYLYTSVDFKHWVKASRPLHSSKNSGMWECPDFYPVSLSGQNGLDTSAVGNNIKHVFKVSLDMTRYEYYTIGSYDKEKDWYIPDEGQIDSWAGLRYDYGNFYASKSFYDPVKSRRILWGWANESDWLNNDPKNDKIKGWAGIQLIPRNVWLDPNGKQLLQWPVVELETLRGDSANWAGKVKNGVHIEVANITAAQADVEVTFTFASLDKAEQFDPKWNNENVMELCAQKGDKVNGGLGPFGLLTLASKNLEEYTPVFFRIYKASSSGYKALMCSDARSSSKRDDFYMPAFGGLVDVDLSNKTITLRSLIDNSVVESFGAGGKIVITSRVYPELAINDNAHLFVFNNGKEPVKVERLTAWNMKKAVMNKRVTSKH